MSDVGAGGRRRYGNWWPTRRATLYGLTVGGWAVLVGGVIAASLLTMFGAWQIGLSILAASLVIVVVFVLRFGDRDGGQTLAERVSTAVGAAGRVGRGEARFNSGLFSNLPAGKLTGLPGVLSDMGEISGRDGLNRPFTLLHHQGVGAVTAVFACNPDGRALQPQNLIDNGVGWYSEWLNSLGADASICGATVVADSALRSHGPLVEQIGGELDPEAPEVARRATLEGAQGLPVRYAESATWVSVSWRVGALADSLEDAVTEVAAKIPFHIDALRRAGGGLVVAATSVMLAECVRVAYAPERSTEFAMDALEGHSSQLAVTQAGPDYFDDSVGRICLHDGVASMSVIVLAPPRLRITEQRFEALFAPSDRFLRKRVAIFYRPVGLGKSQRAVERMTDNADMLLSAKRRPRHDDKRKVEHARQAEAEVGDRGAAIVEFAVAVTVTFRPDKKSHREAVLQVKELLEQTGVSYRFVDFDAAAAFHSTLPLGMLPWMYETVAENYMGSVS